MTPCFNQQITLQSLLTDFNKIMFRPVYEQIIIISGVNEMQFYVILIKNEILIIFDNGNNFTNRFLKF